MLRLEHISYGVPEKPDILTDISLTLEGNETVVFTGPNGGGKTSLAKVIAGVYQAQEGRIFLDDLDITEFGITERAKAGVSYSFQQPVRFKGMTTRDLISLSTGQTLDHQGMCDALSAVGLCAMDYIDREVDTKLSGGEIKRIEIASVMLRKSKVYLFDEPEAGIDLWSFNNLIEVFQGLKKRNDGATIIIISHQERIIDIADKVAVISDGRLSDFGRKDDILPKLAIKPHAYNCVYNSNFTGSAV